MRRTLRAVGASALPRLARVSALVHLARTNAPEQHARAHALMRVGERHAWATAHVGPSGLPHLARASALVNLARANALVRHARANALVLLARANALTQGGGRPAWATAQMRADSCRLWAARNGTHMGATALEPGWVSNGGESACGGGRVEPLPLGVCRADAGGTPGTTSALASTD